MAKYKVTKVYVVEASSKSEAVDKVVKDPDTLQYVSVSLQVDGGFIGAVKKQLGGK